MLQFAVVLVALSIIGSANVKADDPEADDASAVDFARDIQPIFQAHCVSCHGAKKREGGLRLDQRTSAMKDGDAYAPVIVAGKSGESPLVQFISDPDADLQMPPEGQRLEPETVEKIKRWIDAGASWPETKESADVPWAFHMPERPGMVDMDTPWSRTRIDALIAERLAKENLEPSKEAPRDVLIRRLAFDLLGLPPSPEEIVAFVEDRRPDAFERLVDQYLASPRLGERWARHWLDVVRFAESHGFEMNQARPNAWPYRDYVIRSFNEDKPYDHFVIEQLAGDTEGVDEATGMLVAGPWDQVKSPDPVLTAQQRADELHDMINTTGTAFLGLTVGCARCHSHKFDPIPQTDYYALKAVFEGVQHGERSLRPVDFIIRLAEGEKLRREIASIDRQLAALEPKASFRQVQLLDDDATMSPNTEQIAARLGNEPYQPGEERGQINDPGDETRSPNLGRSYSYWNDVAAKDVVVWRPKLAGRMRVWLSWGSGWNTHAPDANYVLDRDGRLDTKDDQLEIARVDQRKFADGSGDMPGRPLWSGFFNAGVHELDAASALILRGGATDAYVTADVVAFEETPLVADEPIAASPHWRAAVYTGRNVDAFAPVEARWVRMTIRGTSDVEPCIDELEILTASPEPRNVAASSNGAKATTSGNFRGSDFHKLEHIHDGIYGNEKSWISNEVGKGWVQIELAEPTLIDHVIWSRDRTDPPRYQDRLALDYVIEISMDGMTWHEVASSADRLGSAYRGKSSSVDLHASPSPRTAEGRKLLAERKSIALKAGQIAAAPNVYSGKFVEPPMTARFHRGDPMQPRENIAPGGLSQIGDPLTLAASTPEKERRKALAHWIASSSNPLTARVIVNRLWQHHFGEGIAATPSDFGAGGIPPSHPEVLDELAVELVERAWSLKDIHRLLVESSAYRQSSQARDDGMSRDAATKLLWRYPPRRIEAEILRDLILSVSGNLNLEMGGRGFDLFEPNDNYVKVYVSRSEFGSNEWRRMVYQSKPRMQLDNVFGAFDCPDGGQIAPKRSRSTTPLQALNLLNSAFIMQQSKIFADRLEREAGPDIHRKVNRAFWLAFGRGAREAEDRAATQLIRDAGLTAFCRAMLNANEFIMVY